MTYEEFAARVEQLETLAKARPQIYRFRALLAGLAGYAYLMFILALLIAGTAYLVFVGIYAESVPHVVIGKMAIAFGLLAYIIIRSLWVRLSPPEGIELTAEQAEPLFAAIEEIRQATNGPQLKAVLLDGSYNASVVQHPRLGIFGGYANYLIIGLPLLAALSPEQFRAVLAHEFGHLSSDHGRSGNWIYRLRATWDQLLAKLEEKEHWGKYLFTPFFNRYVPFFMAYTFVLAREHEYEADRYSAKVAGAETAAAALINLRLCDAQLDAGFWPEIDKLNTTSTSPPADLYTQMQNFLRTTLPLEKQAVILKDAMTIETDYDDTHPALKDRLNALNQAAQLPPPVTETAAAAFLANNLDELTAALNAEWQEMAASAWAERYIEAAEAQQHMAELAEKYASAKLTKDEIFELADLTERFHDGNAALPYYEAILATDLGNPIANFHTGRLLLAADNAAGIPYLEQAIAKEAEAVIPGYEMIIDYLLRSGQEAAAADYQAKAEAHMAILEQAAEERDGLEADNRYLPHSLATNEVNTLREQLVKYPNVVAAYLVRKEVANYPDNPLYVFAFTAVFPKFSELCNADDDEEFDPIEKLSNELDFPGETLVILLEYVNKPKVESHQELKPIIEAIPGALIYRKI